MTDPELHKAHVHAVKMKEVNSLVNRFTKFSDWSRAVRAAARLKRFIREFKGHQPRTKEATSLEERREAEIFIIKLVQEEAFAEDIQKSPMEISSLPLSVCLGYQSTRKETTLVLGSS